MEIEIKTKNLDDDYAYLRDKLRDHNVSVIGTYSKQEPLFLGVYDDNKNLIAGLYAYLSLGKFYIDLLWVDKNSRRQQIGKKLLKKAEEYAAEKGALYLLAVTATFQALTFYKKCGYEVFAQLPLKIEGHKNQYDYYLIKYLE